LLTLSRGAWFGTAAGLVGFAVLMPQSRRRLLAVGAVMLVAAVVALNVGGREAVDIVASRVATVDQPLANPSDERPRIWRVASEAMSEHPVAGVGPGGFPVAWRDAGEATAVGVPLHAHSMVLTVGAELGLAGLLFFAGLVASVGLSATRTITTLRAHGRADAASLIAAAVAALLVYAGQGVVDFTLRNATLHLLAWSLVGVVLAGQQVIRSRPVDRAPAWHGS
jgi:O-antigen ligase